MCLIPQLVSLGGTVSHRLKDSLTVGDVTAEAAASAIELQAYDLALEWMEEGSTLVWRQIMELRNPLDDLCHSHPEFAKSLEEVARNLDEAGTRTTGDYEGDLDSLENASQAHRRLAERYDQLLAQARDLPGFSDFMRPKKASTLAAAARYGPVVVINVHKTRCDALVLLPGSDDITHIPLPQLSHAVVASARRQLTQFLHEMGVKQRGLQHGLAASPDVMDILWRNIVKPIFMHLGYLVSTHILTRISAVFNYIFADTTSRSRTTSHHMVHLGSVGFPATSCRRLLHRATRTSLQLCDLILYSHLERTACIFPRARHISRNTSCRPSEYTWPSATSSDQRRDRSSRTPG